MKIAIVYESKTGNTETIARAIADELGNSVCYIGAPKEDIDADLFVIGSWIDKGSSTSGISDFLASLDGKNVAYFCTAGFGSSREYGEKLAERARELLPCSAHFVGNFCCLGKMPMAVRDRYVSMIHANPNDEHLKVAISNFDEALSHPNADDISNARTWIGKVIDDLT